MHAVGAEIVIFALFAIRNDRRACGLKPLNCVANRSVIERSEIGILTVAFCDSLEEIKRSWDAANWLGGNADWSKLRHTTYRGGDNTCGILPAGGDGVDRPGGPASACRPASAFRRSAC